MARGRPPKKQTVTVTPIIPVETPAIIPEVVPDERFIDETPEKVITPPAKHLTKRELYCNIYNERQTSQATKVHNVNRFVVLHPGFKFPQNSSLAKKIQCIENIALFKLYEAE